ncbi:MAG: hypothetical protein EBR82_60935 [Caulobacteraceae bacterium]|nr:hypothetical protein [Caulobacteraceae bacterium]
MGRYYRGDIEGKFWFGVQSSNDASFFGGEVFEPNYIEYHFNEDDLPEIKKGLDNCDKELGEWEKIIDDFFDKVDGYNDRTVEEHNLDVKVFNEKLEWYARKRLGEKIYKCVKEHKVCDFEAEL